MRTSWKHRLGIICIAVFAVASMGLAQDDSTVGWKTSVVFDLTVTQNAYSDSWEGGEAGSVNWVSNLNSSAEKQLSPSFNYKSTLKLSFGQTFSQKFLIDTLGNEYKNWEKPQKSTDLIDWENVGRITKNWFVDPYIAFRLESQFVDATIDAKKIYLNPMLLTESAGIARKLYAKDKSEITSRLGFAIRQKTIKTPVTVDGINWTTTSETLTDGGFESVTDVKFVFNEDLQWTCKLTLYKAISSSDTEGLEPGTEDYWKAVDVNFENRIVATITKIVSVNFFTQFLYDKEVSTQGRFKETLGLGVTFNLM